MTSFAAHGQPSFVGQSPHMTHTGDGWTFHTYEIGRVPGWCEGGGRSGQREKKNRQSMKNTFRAGVEPFSRMYNRNSLKLCTFYRSFSFVFSSCYVFLSSSLVFLLSSLRSLSLIYDESQHETVSSFLPSSEEEKAQSKKKKVFLCAQRKMDNFYHFSALRFSFLLHFIRIYRRQIVPISSCLFLLRKWQPREEGYMKITCTRLYWFATNCLGGARRRLNHQQMSKSQDTLEGKNHTQQRKGKTTAKPYISSNIQAFCKSINFHPLIMWNNVLCSANDLRDYEMHIHRVNAVFKLLIAFIHWWHSIKIIFGFPFLSIYERPSIYTQLPVTATSLWFYREGGRGNWWSEFLLLLWLIIRQARHLL